MFLNKFVSAIPVQCTRTAHHENTKIFVRLEAFYRKVIQCRNRKRGDFEEEEQE